MIYDTLDPDAAEWLKTNKRPLGLDGISSSRLRDSQFNAALGAPLPGPLNPNFTLCSDFKCESVC